MSVGFWVGVFAAIPSDPAEENGGDSFCHADSRSPEASRCVGLRPGAAQKDRRHQIRSCVLLPSACSQLRVWTDWRVRAIHITVNPFGTPTAPVLEIFTVIAFGCVTAVMKTMKPGPACFEIQQQVRCTAMGTI